MPLDATDFRIDVANPDKAVDADKHALFALRSIRRAIAEFGWIKGQYRGHIGHDRCFVGWCQYYGLNDDEQADFCEWYVLPALPKRYQKQTTTGIGKLIRFNDSKSTTKGSMLRMIDRAIALIPPPE